MPSSVHQLISTYLLQATNKIISERMALHFKESIEGTVELLKQQKAAAEKKEDVAVILLFHFRGIITDV